MPTQNGVDAPDTLAELLGAAHVVGGYTRITSLLTGPGAVSHTAIHPAVQGTGVLECSAPWAGEELARAAAVWEVRARARALKSRHSRAPAEACRVHEPRGQSAQRSPFLRLVVEEDVLLSMWRKLTIMAAYSTVTALGRCPIGPIVSSPDARNVLLQCMRETVAVARAVGVRMTDADVDGALAILESLPPGCTPSMMRDLTAGRPSELDDQAGAVVRIGAKHAVPLPVLGSLYALLRPQERATRGELVMPVMLDCDVGEPREWHFIEYHI